MFQFVLSGTLLRFMQKVPTFAAVLKLQLPPTYAYLVYQPLNSTFLFLETSVNVREASANIPVGVRRRVVQVQEESTNIGIVTCIVAVTTNNRIVKITSVIVEVFSF